MKLHPVLLVPTLRHVRLQFAQTTACSLECPALHVWHLLQTAPTSAPLSVYLPGKCLYFLLPLEKSFTPFYSQRDLVQEENQFICFFKSISSFVWVCFWIFFCLFCFCFQLAFNMILESIKGFEAFHFSIHKKCGKLPYVE